MEEFAVNLYQMNKLHKRIEKDKGLNDTATHSSYRAERETDFRVTFQSHQKPQSIPASPQMTIWLPFLPPQTAF